MFLVSLSCFITGCPKAAGGAAGSAIRLSRVSGTAGCNHMLAECKGKWKSALEQNRGVCYNRRDIL